jgi:hypothetical protein
MCRTIVLCALAAAALAVGPTAGTAAPPPLPHVTLIGDSVADALNGNRPALDVLGAGIDLELEIAPCRRVGQDSCPYNGVRPPNVIELVRSMGARLGPTVIVAVGYNDFEDQYAGNVEEALDDLEAAGVKRVLWATLRAAHHPYISMNEAIVAAAGRHPSTTVVDWNLYARSHPEWFQDDGVHLAGDGPLAMATLFHRALEQLDVPARPPAPPRITTTALPDARLGRPYAAALAATGADAPYRWSSGARLPAGLHLGRGGRLSGTPRAGPGLFRLSFRVVSADGTSATAQLALRVRA